MTWRTHLAPLAAACAALAIASGDAAADLRAGQNLLLRGDYQGARTELARIAGKDRKRARLLLCRVHMRTGEYAEAEKQARALTGDGDPKIAADARVALAEALRATGRYADARRELEPLLAANPDHLRARYVLGVTYRDLGEMPRAAAVFETFFTDWNSGKIDQNDAAQLYYVAQAARYTSAFEDANHTFRESVTTDPNLLEANIEWGYFGLEKYAVALAEQSFDEVLKIDAHHPDAHNGMALVKLEQSYDLAAATHHLETALAANPRHIPSLITRASLEIDQNKWDAAKATLNEVFAVNPMCLEGRALLATVHWLRDDMAAYEAERHKVFAANPAYAEFYHIVARSAVREHRYVEAIKLEQEAVAVDPKYYEAMQAVGTGYLRLGQEKEGVEWLRKSWEGDEYNVRTYNTLNLFEEEIPKQYSFTTTRYFKFRYHNDEQDMLRRYIEPTLDRAFESMVRRYKFTPVTPVVIELFRDPDHYSVRTVGLPNLGALGVCFGQVITAMSPSVGNVNWGMVLWHELSHVFAIQLSNSRVPRWYTEGLSEYETLIARPEWRRENDADLWAALQENRIPSVAELNYNFMKPDMQEVVVAYYLSAVTIEYIAARYGFDRIVEGLRLFGKGDETPAVIEKITGGTVAQFDAEFRTYLEQRLRAYRGTYHIPTTGRDDLTKLEIAVDAHPDDPAAHADLARGHFFDGKALEALAAAEKALALAPKNRIALYVAAEVALRQRDAAKAQTLYLALLEAGGDSFDVRGRLAMIAQQQGDDAEAEKQLCAAKRLDPERSYPYMELSELYAKAGRMDESLAELETYVMLEQMQYGPVAKLVDEYSQRKQWAKVRTFGELALYINLSDAELYVKLGTAYLETGSPDKALFTFDSALLARPELRRPALAHLGKAKAYLALDRKRDARASLRSAMKLEPENADALELQKLLGRR